jgi:heat shock protein HslJ
MNRRRFMFTTVAGCAALSVPGIRLTAAQESTPVAGSAIQNIRWELQQIAESDGSVVTPDNPANYWIQFGGDGRIYVQADCNRAGGPFTLNGSELTIGDMFSTMALCDENSIADQFMASLGSIASYVVTTDASDQLVLEMMADGGSMNFKPVLPGVVWQWVEFQSSDGSVVTAADPSRYTIEFLDDGSLQVLADCNRGFGDATINGNEINRLVATTRMMCDEDSQSNDFLLYLDQAVSYVIRDGMLALALPADAGIALFQPVFVVETEVEAEATPAM